MSPDQADVPGVSVLTVDGVVVARFQTREATRPGVSRELTALRERGLDL